MIPASKAKRSGLDYVAPATASISTGALNRLPLEVMHNLLGYLDIAAIGYFRCLSWNTRVIVDLFPPYRDLATHASSVLRVLYATHLASTYSVWQLYTVLTNDRCVCCEAFGPFLSLITCERCCFSCLYDSKMAPTTLAIAAATFGLSKNKIEQKIPVVETLPGIYTILRKKRTRALKAVSVEKVLALAVEKVNKTQYAEEDVAKLDERARRFFRDYNDPLRFMVSTPIPYLNTRDRRTELGVWCRGCEWEWRGSMGQTWSSHFRRRVLDTAYSKEEYLRHFEECKAAQELWERVQGEGEEHIIKHLYRGRHPE
jgi:hypothetical protein